MVRDSDIKTVRLSQETWKALMFLKAIKNFRSMDQTIKFLLKFYQENRGEKK